MQNNNDLNAGAATPGSSDPSVPGSQDVNPGASSTTPDNQNGNPTVPGRDDTTRMREEIKRLNQAVVDARRGNRNNNQQNGQGNENNFDTPEGQYGIAIQLATGNLRNKLEDVISLYPEIPANEVSRIRKNPWAFVKLETYQSADWETAALEVEQAMLERAEEIAASNPAPVNNPIPANLNSNPVQDAGDEPVSPEDDDWNMPLDQLEAKAKKAVAKVSKSK